jgi:hypothetical protein
LLSYFLLVAMVKRQMRVRQKYVLSEMSGERTVGPLMEVFEDLVSMSML